MKVITEIREARRRTDRYEVVADSAILGTLSVREIADLGLREGRSVNGDLESRIHVASERLAVYDRALAMLARSARSVFDMRRRLLARGDAASAVAWALARLQQEGILSDETFASQYARSRMARGASRSAVLSGLLRVAVPRATAEKVIADLVADAGWPEEVAASRAASKKIPSLRKLDATVARRRLAGFMKRRGFKGDDIRAALQRLQENADG